MKRCTTCKGNLVDIPENDDPLRRTRVPGCWYEPQSGEGEAGREIIEATEMVTQEVTAFADQDAGYTDHVAGGGDATMDLALNNDATLGDFLKRPVMCKRFSWLVGQPFYEEFNPWAEIITHPANANKLANYELLRMNVKVKFVISGTGFHYGRALASYNPLTGTYDEVTVTRNFLDQDLIAASQRPHIFLNPTDNSGGEIDIPYFFLQNYMSLSGADYNDMGTINIKSFGNLQHANGGTDPVYVTCYVWAEDVVLTMPTSTVTAPPLARGITTAPTAYVPQAGGRKGGKKSRPAANTLNSGDEYGKGIISAPASAVARAAGMLSAIPAIAPYARATEMVASKVGQVAALFGYSRPPVITDIVLQKPSPTGNLANTDAADACNKLSLDSKQELTIDSRTVGLDGTDQMDLKSFGSRESYLTSFTWAAADAPDGILWNSAVTPNLFGILGDELHPTPMSMLAQYFTYWQGSIKFRFQIVKSAFHKGRILVRYDPKVHGATPDYSSAYSRVVDIAEEDDFEIVVGWGQNVPFLANQLMATNRDYYNTSRLSADSTGSLNGVLEINVVNSLVSPTDLEPIRINVFVSACDDMKWGAPHPSKMSSLHIFPEVTPVRNQSLEYVPQSGLAEPDSATDVPIGADTVQGISSTLGVDDPTMEVFFGEEPVSLREIFRRYVKQRTWVPPALTADSTGVATLNYKAFPYYSGDDPSGLDLQADAITPVSIVKTHPLSFFAPCYAAWRGGLRHKWLITTNTPTCPIVERNNYNTNNGWTMNEALNTADNAFYTKFFSNRCGAGTNAGSAATNIGVNNTIEVEHPFYLGNRMVSTRIVSAPNLQGHSGKLIFPVSSNGAGANLTNYSAICDDYVATGEDFSLFFFTGCPILYQYSVTETS